MSDNFHFDIAGIGSLSDFLTIAFSDQTRAVGYRVEERLYEPPRLILYGYTSEKMNPFPSPLDKTEVEPAIISWLKSIDFGPEPDIDGHCKKGFRVYNDNWTHINGEWGTFVAIEPYWVMYGK